MLDTCINNIASFLLRNNAISKDEMEIHIYGIRKIVGILLTVIITMFLSIIMDKVFATVLFLFFFIGIRSYTGGYHAKSQMKCFGYFQVIYLSSMFLFQPAIQNLTVVVKLSLVLIAATILIVFAPINHPNLCLTEIEKNSTKKSIAVVMVITFIFLLLLYVVFKSNHVDFALVGLLDATILVVLAKILKQEVSYEKG